MVYLICCARLHPSANVTKLMHSTSGNNDLHPKDAWWTTWTALGSDIAPQKEEAELRKPSRMRTPSGRLHILTDVLTSPHALTQRLPLFNTAREDRPPLSALSGCLIGSRLACHRWLDDSTSQSRSIVPLVRLLLQTPISVGALQGHSEGRIEYCGLLERCIELNRLQYSTRTHELRATSLHKQV